MKKITAIATLAILASMVLFLSNCGGSKVDPTPVETEAQKNTRLLTAGAWSVQTVLVDAVDKTTVYKDLKLTFSSTGFTSTGGGSVWPATGTWKFKDDTGKTIDRGDGLSITATEISATKLVLGLTWTKTTLAGGRAESVAGQHVFTFGK